MADVSCTAILTDMSKLTKESDLKKAQIRIFCDDDDRWVPRDENKGGGFIDKKKYAEYHLLITIIY
jgi:hypothetical protein